MAAPTETPKSKPAIKSVLLELLMGGLGATVIEKGQEVLSPDGSLLGSWQRKEGEPLLSTKNILKMGALLAGVAVYNKVDPFKDTKADNIILSGFALYLASLLVIPQSNDLGSHFEDFEGNLLMGLREFAPEETENVMKWLASLDHRQERQLSAVVGRFLERKDGNTKDDAAFERTIKSFADPTFRNVVDGILHKEPIPASLLDVIDDFRKETPTDPNIARIKALVFSADQNAADKVHQLRKSLPWLHK